MYTVAEHTNAPSVPSVGRAPVSLQHCYHSALLSAKDICGVHILCSDSQGRPTHDYVHNQVFTVSGKGNDGGRLRKPSAFPYIIPLRVNDLDCFLWYTCCPVRPLLYTSYAASCRGSWSSCAASSSTGRLKRIRAQRSLRYSSGP